ncbi:MAG: ABC transporter permease [Candidatus Bathycorpusculaceae bacterium]
MRLLTLCFRNLFRRKMRTSLCIAGVALATTFVVAVGATTMRYVTVIREMNVLFSGQIMVVSKNAVVIQAIPITRGSFQERLAEEITTKIEGVEKAVPVLFITSINLDELQLIPPNFTLGIPLEEWRLMLGPTPLKEDIGHFPTSEDSNEVVVGASLAGQYNWAVGDNITINGYNVTVVGILDTKLAILNRCIVMPLKLAQTIYVYPDSVNMITVKPIQNYPHENLTEAIEEEYSYLKALTEEERNDIIQPVLDQVGLWSFGIQTVVFAISLILVMTVTLMSVSERRRDFATLDAIGAPLSYVFRVVLVETALIGAFAGALGVAFGAIASIVLASLYTNIPLALFFPSIFEIVPPTYMVEMFTAIVAICCLGGVIPAVNATRTRIAEVLRAEY